MTTTRSRDAFDRDIATTLNHLRIPSLLCAYQRPDGSSAIISNLPRCQLADLLRAVVDAVDDTPGQPQSINPTH
jgi:hypothetical protein